MSYIRQASEIKGNHVAFTEINIKARPEVVRAHFLDFDKWSEWCAVIPKIAVKSGDLNDLSTKPTIELTLDFGRKNDPSKAPVSPNVTENTPEVFNWGFSIGVLKAEHVFIFEPINNGKATRLVHYERMSGILKSLTMTSKVKANMIEKYNTMNEALKNLCE
jgi:hypothetical protein